ncbi:hypothetical protein [Desulfofundulus salinus]|uniref:Uncharacterized protein n=1 Tax=Desulfofundulus salinus TaxID=2419843 RepID=A0A494X3F3_9FIRM|nr:hypothetical protein [Desulfofundulus salinum]RKO67374.1 hypothetical protein D7024_10640 [Desulfofundulus salinum]
MSDPKAPVQENRPNCPPCYHPVPVGSRGEICVRYGCSPSCAVCPLARVKNTPACFQSLPGFPEYCISEYFIPECKRFCKYAVTEI